MKNLTLLLLFSICTITSCTTWSQTGILAFANKSTNEQGKSSEKNHKYETAKMVFDSLVAGQGDFRRQRPSLVMKNSERYVAWARPERAEIGLEELAYDICASFGVDSLNALAALLTHELVHYYKEHDWNRHFVKENEDLSTAKKLEKLEEGLKLETQADYIGGFMAYSVGFEVHGIMPELLKKIYAETGYDLPKEIDGYPSLEERIAMSGNAMDQLKELQVVFEMSTYLNLLEYHEDASLYYNYILKDFQSRDIYNNAGVTALLSALPYFTKKEMPYGLPIELDPTSRLAKNTTRTNDQSRVQEREKRIQQALEYFEWALLLDRQYPPAYLNTAAAYVLLEDWDEANYWIKKTSKQNLNEKMTADLLVLKGIVAAQQEDLKGAKDWWEKATAASSNLATVNLDVLEHGAIQGPPKIYGFAAKKEQIEAVNVEKFLMETAPDKIIEINDRKACGYHLRPASKVYSHLVDAGNEYLIVQIVSEDFSGKSLEGIAIGDNLELLIEKYGIAERQVQTPEGAFYIYPDRKMIFQLNAMTGVQGWGIYRLKEKK